MESKKRNLIIKKLIIVILFTVISSFLVYKFYPQIIGFIKNPEQFRSFIISQGFLGIFVLIGFQIIQILIPFIPGEIVQITGGYVFGVIAGSFYLLTGTIIGGVIAFYISRLIGFPFIKLIIKEETLSKFDFLVKSKKIEISIFVLFLLPGVPKDILIYLAGITPINALRFFVILSIARLPGVLVTTAIGHNLMQKDYNDIYILASIVAIFIILGLIFRKRLIKSIGDTH